MKNKTFIDVLTEAAELTAYADLEFRERCKVTVLPGYSPLGQYKNDNNWAVKLSISITEVRTDAGTISIYDNLLFSVIVTNGIRTVTIDGQEYQDYNQAVDKVRRQIRGMVEMAEGMDIDEVIAERRAERVWLNSVMPPLFN